MKNDKLKVEDVNAVLSHWEKIKVLRLSKKMTLIGVDLNANPMLRKIVIPVDMSLKELGAWGKATKIWFDPKHFWNPVKLENVVQVRRSTPKSSRATRASALAQAKAAPHSALRLRDSGPAWTPQMALERKWRAALPRPDKPLETRGMPALARGLLLVSKICW